MVNLRFPVSRYARALHVRMLYNKAPGILLTHLQHHSPAIDLPLLPFNGLGLPLGLEAPIMTPNGVIFSLFLSSFYPSMQWLLSAVCNAVSR